MGLRGQFIGLERVRQHGNAGVCSAILTECDEIDTGDPITRFGSAAERDGLGIEVALDRMVGLESHWTPNVSTTESPAFVRECVYVTFRTRTKVRSTLANVFPILSDPSGANMLLSAGIVLVGDLDDDIVPELTEDLDGSIHIARDVVDDRHGQDEIKVLDLREQFQRLLGASVVQNDARVVAAGEILESRLILRNTLDHDGYAIEVLHQSEAEITKIAPDVEDSEWAIELRGILFDNFVTIGTLANTGFDLDPIDPLSLILFHVSCTTRNLLK